MKQIVTTVAVAVCLFSGLIQAKGDAAAGQAKAAICAACHGADGNSTNPLWPKLAGQHAKYIAKQVRDIKAGITRTSAVMAPMVGNLSDQDIDDIAAYFATQSRTGGFASEGRAALGEKIYRGGNSATGLPACMSCHGPRGAGNPLGGIPSVSGQHAQYAHKQLEDFRADFRSNDPNRMMRDVVRFLTLKEMAAVSEYMAGLY